eukprot:scaffold2707_cov169-Amphora_coffeaeformis.AAC.1
MRWKQQNGDNEELTTEQTDGRRYHHPSDTYRRKTVVSFSTSRRWFCWSVCPFGIQYFVSCIDKSFWEDYSSFVLQADNDIICGKSTSIGGWNTMFSRRTLAASLLGLVLLWDPTQSFYPSQPTNVLTRHISRTDSFSDWRTPTTTPRARPTDSATTTTELGLFGLNQNNEPAVELTHETKPQVYPQRWVQLAYLSALALLSDWICFSVAAAPDVYEGAFQHSAATIIDIFLFTNVGTCFLVTDIVNRFGLQKAVQAAAVLMAVGCWFRSGTSFLPVIPGAEHLMSYTSIVLGTVMVGAAQPFFQCTPPVLSATWFAPSERATSTAVALNFNQIGIATAFLVGGSMVTDGDGLELYFGIIAVLSTLTAVGALLQFQDEPPIPPSSSEIEKRIEGEVEPPFLDSVQRFFQKPGFTKALAAFICSVSVGSLGYLSCILVLM